MARQRSSNFSAYVKNILSELMEEFSNVLEDKKTDNTTVKKKEDTWAILCNRFHGSTRIKERPKSDEGVLEKLKRESQKGCGRGYFRPEGGLRPRELILSARRYAR
ncbi:hypothetical protein J4Q44_G00200170 [Coregonus suidteri]|uniref:Myb/SANT-like DNA-binding domain-containing protein n=1 Tax=Coregonus suidteri TaxID=861788 RepID=A0AAN8LTI9_9TELE